MAHYVIGDVHGQLDILKTLLQRIGYNPAEDMLYFVGDYVDWGPKSIETLLYVMELAKNPNVHCVLGNHDWMMLKTIKSDMQMLKTRKGWTVWAENNGAETLEQYLGLSAVQQEDIKKWLENLPLYIDNVRVGERTYSIAHATRLLRGREPRANQTEDAVWYRLQPNEDPFGGNKEFENCMLVCGHTITYYIPGHNQLLPYFGKHYINIDTGAKAIGLMEDMKLTALRLEDLQFTFFPTDKPNKSGIRKSTISKSGSSAERMSKDEADALEKEVNCGK